MNEATVFDSKFLFMGRLNSTVFKKEGGPHFGAVRGRIQTMFRNGESVTWGSHNTLHPSATVDNLEELASVVAESVLRSIHEYMPRNNVFNQNSILRLAVEKAQKILAADSGRAAAMIVLNTLNEALEKANCQCGKIPHNLNCKMR